MVNFMGDTMAYKAFEIHHHIDTQSWLLVVLKEQQWNTLGRHIYIYIYNH